MFLHAVLIHNPLQGAAREQFPPAVRLVNVLMENHKIYWSVNNKAAENEVEAELPGVALQKENMFCCGSLVLSGFGLNG